MHRATINEKNRCSKTTSHWMLPLLTVALLLCGIRWMPTNIIALNPSELQKVKRAEQAIAKKQWSKANELLEELVVEPKDELATHITEQIQWCRANISVEKRYADPTLVKSNLSISIQQAMKQLDEVIDLVEEKYYLSVDYHDLLQYVLLQMNALLDRDEIMHRYSVNRYEIKQLREQINAFNDFLASSQPITRKNIINIAQSLSQIDPNEKLGQSWPILEMSYAIAKSLDRYSYLLSPMQYQAMQDRLQGFYVGIGVDIVQNEDYPIVFDVISSGPAKKAGVQAGDILIQASGQNLLGLSHEQIGKYLGGQKGSVIELIVRRDQTEILLQVHCDIINAPSVRSIQMLAEYQSVGYFRISGFDRDTAMEMRRAVDSLKRDGATSLMIDLRYNGGGMMTSAIDAVRLFMNQGVITTVQTGEQRLIYRAGGDGFTAYQLPLVLLVDQNTASAAEIFVAALKDQQRATVVGETTFGKGLVQTVYHLKNSESALCITTASFVPPSNNSFHLSGITPDVLIKNVSQGREKMFTIQKIGDDPILQVALQQVLSEKTL